jgi:hypothetical protein
MELQDEQKFDQGLIISDAQLWKRLSSQKVELPPGRGCFVVLYAGLDDFINGRPEKKGWVDPTQKSNIPDPLRLRERFARVAFIRVPVGHTFYHVWFVDGNPIFDDQCLVCHDQLKDVKACAHCQLAVFCSDKCSRAGGVHHM